MAAENNLIKKEDVLHVISVDFKNRFVGDLHKLKELIGVTRSMEVMEGMQIKTYKSTTTLANGDVAEGEDIPLSKVTTTAGDPITISLQKYRKAVSGEAIQRSTFQAAVVETDDKMLKEIQKTIRAKFFDNLKKTGSTAITKPEDPGLQGALAAAWGKIQTLFEDDGVNTVAFVNPEDAAAYLGSANITTQTAFGMTFITGFTNTTVILNSQVPKGTVYATAPENLVLAYIPVNRSELAHAFDYVTDDSGYIGVGHGKNDTNLTYETYATMGVTFFAERLDGIVKVTITKPEKQVGG